MAAERDDTEPVMRDSEEEVGTGVVPAEPAVPPDPAVSPELPGPAVAAVLPVPAVPVDVVDAVEP